MKHDRFAVMGISDFGHEEEALLPWFCSGLRLHECVPQVLVLAIVTKSHYLDS